MANKHSPARDASLAPQTARGPAIAQPTTALERWRRRRRVARLKLRGQDRREIARAVGVSVRTVERDLAALAQLSRERAGEDASVLRQQELARLGEVEQEAWKAWRRSQQDDVEMFVERDGQGRTKSRKRTKSRHGDAALLRLVAVCVQERCKLLALALESRDESEPADRPLVREIVVADPQQAQRVLRFEEAYASPE